MSQARPHDGDDQPVSAADPDEPAEPAAATVEPVAYAPDPPEQPEPAQERSPEQPEVPQAELGPARPATEAEEDDAPFIDSRIWWDEAPAEAAQLPPQEPAQDRAAEPAPAPPDQPAAPPAPRDETRALPAGTVLPSTRIHSQQGLSAAALRDVGRVRSVNQDSVFALLTTLPRESSDLSMGLFIVADGMGGHANGEVASRMAISTVARTVLADLVVPALADGVTEALQPLIVSAVQEANRAIWERARSEGSDMGTTCTTALMLGHTLYIAHVGDSRLYIRTPEGLRCLTTDHSAIGRLIQLGQLDEAEAREHPMRSQLYRTVGQMPEVQVDFIYHQLGQATHLLLCSDGLWSMLDEAVLLDVLDNSLWPQDACRELVARANLAGGEDNIGVVVVALPSA
jgi:serine/threonine protein phosphatase PrpC